MLDSHASAQSAADQDHQKYIDMRDSSHKDLLTYAAKASGRSPLRIQREFGEMARSDGQINMVEYVRNGLYDIDRHSAEARAQFISNDLHWPITHTCNDRGWSGSAEDKAVAGTLLATGGVPVPDTVAIIDRSARIFPGYTKISTPEALRDFVTATPGQRYFGKITGGMVSFGAFCVTGGDAERIHCEGHDPMRYADFLNEFVGTSSYLLQKVLTNHSGFAQYASALATVRMVNLVSDDGVYCPMSVIKLPQGDNIADAFWRPGNLACAVDVDTGRIETVARRGIETEFLPDHPEVAGLMGLCLPHWDALREINERAARIFAPIRYQSTDIAITEAGPVVVEINYGGGFDLPQYASGKGMLTPKVRAFFEGCGYKFGARATKRKRFGLF